MINSMSGEIFSIAKKTAIMFADNFDQDCPNP
jgi:hypothetical protein